MLGFLVYLDGDKCATSFDKIISWYANHFCELMILRFGILFLISRGERDDVSIDLEKNNY